MALQKILQRNIGTAGKLETKHWDGRNACNETVAPHGCLQRMSGTAGMLVTKPWHCRNSCTELWHCTNYHRKNATRRHSFNKPFNCFNQQVHDKRLFHYGNQKYRKVPYGATIATRPIPVALTDRNNAYGPAYKNDAKVKRGKSFRDSAAVDSLLINDCVNVTLSCVGTDV